MNETETIEQLVKEREALLEMIYNLKRDLKNAHILIDLMEKDEQEVIPFWLN